MPMGREQAAGNDRIDKAMIHLRKPSKIAALLLTALLVGVFAGMARSDTAGQVLDPAAAPTPNATHPPSATATVSAPPSDVPPAASAAPHELPPPPRPTPEQQFAALTLEQRVGQLFMVAAKADGTDADTVADLVDNHVGNIYLAGRSQAGVAATASVVARLRGAVSPASAVCRNRPGGRLRPSPQGTGFPAYSRCLGTGQFEP
jgi:beta-N-acetylhexosaminidase